VYVLSVVADDLIPCIWYRITISLSVNHSVDAEVPNEDAKGEPKEGIEMKSKPNFDVEIVKAGETMSFSCSFMRDEGQHDPQEEYGMLKLIIYSSSTARTSI